MRDSRNDYEKAGKLLKEKGLEFYTHDAPGSKPLKVLVRGLPEFTPEAIIEEMALAGLKLTNVFKIRRAQGGRHRDQLYLAHLEKGSTTMASLTRVRALFNIFVEWERYRPKNRDVTQCGNCLAFSRGNCRGTAT